MSTTEAAAYTRRFARRVRRRLWACLRSPATCATRSTRRSWTRSSASRDAAIALVERSGGRHHGYFLPSEGASDVAYALFTFPSLAAYEAYRQGFGHDPDFVAADRIREESGCVRRYERSFLRPLLEGDAGA